LLTGRKLLLADDSLTIQKVVSLTFNDEAMEVATVGSGAEALESLNESLPDIVLADVFMPEPNGYELCARIKAGARTRHIPVVLLVGTFEPFNEAEARRVGADEVLTKPFQSIRDLVNKVGGLLGGSDEKQGDAESARDRQRAEETTRDLSPYADDARAAEPTNETAAANAATDAFKDFDMDDATIQSTPAAAFDARAGHESSVLEINEEEQFSDRGETDEAFLLSDDQPPTQAHAANASSAPSAGNSFPASSNPPAEPAPVAASAFSTHAARAAEADDALLELGDIAPAHSNAANVEADDFILDIGDDDDSFEPLAAAPQHSAPTEHSAVDEFDMLFAENAPVTTDAPVTHAQETFAEPERFAEPELFAEPESFTEPEVFAQPQAADELEMWASPAAVEEAEPTSHAPEPEALAETNESAATQELEAPEISESPSLLFANEPDTDVLDSESFPEQESARPAGHAPAWDGDPVAASIVAHAGSVAPVEASGESQTAESFATDASFAAATTADASPTVASSESNQAASSASSLSPKMLDEIVRRVVAQMSEQVVREIAWEVVPDLAERLIKRRLEEEKTRTTP
jgi:CheY-like chemotaxis protein